MSDYMPKCATCEHFESCIMQKHITEMALILWNISREKEKERTVNKPRRKRGRVMSRYIDYDAIDYRNDKMHDKSSDFIDGVIYMAQRIEDAPSINIVRCGECKYKQQCHKAVEHTTHKPTSVTIAYRPIDFCSYGVKKGADDE